MAKDDKEEITVDLEEFIGGLNEMGQEVPDPTPVEMPSGRLSLL